METIQVTTASKQYPVYLGAGAIAALAPFLKKHFPTLKKLMIISDHHVSGRYLEEVLSQLKDYSVVTHLVPNGESCKTFEVYYECLTAALSHKLDRQSIILAFGGGAVGDLSGFVAASFMRGIPFIQLPTTILAHDSAVGGKVAINHPLGKNMIGAFYQPEAVVYDLKFLRSLPEVEIRSGFAEIIKHALIHDRNFLDWLLTEISSLADLRDKQLQDALSEGIKIKASVVAEDEKETGIRAYLNFGHTLGHAIEAELGYGAISHGEAVAIGMVFALHLSKDKGHLQAPIQPIIDWMNTLGYSTTLPEGLSIERLINRMKQDKKSIHEIVNFVLLEDVGKPMLIPVDEKLLVSELKSYMKEREN